MRPAAVMSVPTMPILPAPLPATNAVTFVSRVSTSAFSGAVGSPPNANDVEKFPPAFLSNELILLSKHLMFWLAPLQAVRGSGYAEAASAGGRPVS